MTGTGHTPEDFEMDTLILNYVTQACSEVLGDRKAAEQVALKVSVSPRVEYAALCYMSESEPWETLAAAVRDVLAESEQPLYSREDVVTRFLSAQQADFSRAQVMRMISEADRDGQSSYGRSLGYHITRVGDLYRATVAGREI